MKAVVYSIRSFEKEPLALANLKKHEITLISNSLNLQTAIYAQGKDAVLIFTNDDASAPVIEKLAALGVKYLVTRSIQTDQIDLHAAARCNIKVATIPSCLPVEIAAKTIAHLDAWQQNKCVGKACACVKNCRVKVAVGLF